jgi:hypothetical protein
MTAAQLVLAYIGDQVRRNAEAYQYVEYLELEGPREDESGVRFRERISGALRDRGMVIEAHEALRGRRWSASADPGLGHPDSVLTGLAGHVAITMQRGAPYSHDGVSQVGDEIAAGVVMTNRDRSGEAIAAAFAILGPAGALDLLDRMAP